ncbi:MAG: hypothetical protein L0Y64_22785, partial [Myxococcaceae bacterium]|nr:hypothetical protein [Myxococcaceae bacterium]
VMKTADTNGNAREPLSAEQRERIQQFKLKYINSVLTNRDPGFAPVAERFRAELHDLLSGLEDARFEVLSTRLSIRRMKAQL